VTTIITIELDQIQLSPFRQGFSLPVPSPALLELAQEAGFDALPRMRVRGTHEAGYELINGINTYVVANFLQRFNQAVELVELNDETCRLLVTMDYAAESSHHGARALALGHLIEKQSVKSGISKTACGRRLGLSVKETSLYVRLTRLCDDIQTMLKQGDLSVGVAKLLIKLSETDQVRIAQKAIEENWTTRQAEQEIRALGKPRDVIPPFPPSPPPPSGTAFEHVVKEEQRLSEAIGSEVEVIFDKESRHGELIIRFVNLDVYEGIAERLAGPRGEQDY
jgi:ParB family chromosome partitioning protein